MEFVPLLLMVSIVKKVVDFVKYATSGDVNALVTQLVAWAVGIGLAFLAATSDWADNFDVNGQPVSTLNGWSLVFVGLAIASTAGFGWDAVKAIDGSNSAVVPNLLARPYPATATPPVTHQPVVEPPA
jgi:hypothetical protein